MILKRRNTTIITITLLKDIRRRVPFGDLSGAQPHAADTIVSQGHIFMVRKKTTIKEVMIIGIILFWILIIFLKNS